MRTSLIIIDDFLDNAQAFRDAILKLDFPEDHRPKGYPGRNSAVRIQIPGLEQEISRIVQEPLRAKTDAGHGGARITLEGDKGMADVHIDPGYWSGILYLSRPEDCQGGTDLFRHKATGTERACLEKNDLEALGVTDLQEANKIFNEILLKDTHNAEAWERTMRVPMRFNRLVLIRPWLWHTAGPGFGTNLENGRLIYLLFFDLASG